MDRAEYQATVSDAASGQSLVAGVAGWAAVHGLEESVSVLVAYRSVVVRIKSDAIDSFEADWPRFMRV